jgi:ribonuclease D
MSRPNKVSHKLKDVVRRELAVELDKDHQKADWGGQLTEEMLPYAANDTKVLLPLAETLTLKAKEAKLELAAEIECRALPAFAWMANVGLPFDRKGWTEHLKGLEKEKRLLTKELDELVPEAPDGKARNWNSHLQVKEAFGLAGVELPNQAFKPVRHI